VERKGTSITSITSRINVSTSSKTLNLNFCGEARSEATSSRLLVIALCSSLAPLLPHLYDEDGIGQELLPYSKMLLHFRRDVRANALSIPIENNKLVIVGRGGERGGEKGVVGKSMPDTQTLISSKAWYALKLWSPRLSLIKAIIEVSVMLGLATIRIGVSLFSPSEGLGLTSLGRAWV